MNAHRSLQRRDIVERGLSDMALLVASEFSRAASRAHHRSNVLNCYRRAQEILGIMETLPLSDEAAAFLQPLYRQCSSDQLVAEPRLAPEVVQELGTRLAEAFQRAAEQLPGPNAHA